MTVLPVATNRDYPQMIAETDHVEPVPRRVRATLGGEQIFDTTRARYVWEWAYYPQYYIPVDDIDPRFLVRRKPRAAPAPGHGTPPRPARGQPGPPRYCAGLRRRDDRRGGPAPPASTGTHSMRGMRRTSRSSSIPATRMCVSTRSARIATSGPRSRESRWPKPARLCWCWRPACRPATTLTAPMSPLSTLCPPLPRRPARTKVSPAATGRCAPAMRSATATRIWRGHTTTRPGSCCPSPAWSPSTTKRSTSTFDGLRLPPARTHFFK